MRIIDEIFKKLEDDNSSDEDCSEEKVEEEKRMIDE